MKDLPDSYQLSRQLQAMIAEFAQNRTMTTFQKASVIEKSMIWNLASLSLYDLKVFV